jgi:hypothetical protein
MFDRKSQFDRSFFDRTFSLGTPLPARIASRFTVATRTALMTLATRAGPFSVVAYK